MPSRSDFVFLTSNKQLAFVEHVLEAEVNPLIVKRDGDGVVAVDGLIVKR